MKRSVLLVVSLTAAALAAADSKPPAGKKHAERDPRPGQHWVEIVPTSGGAKSTLLLTGKESSWFAIGGKEEIVLAVHGPTRLLVSSRLDFASRTGKPAGTHWFWRMDGGPEKKQGFKASPHRTAIWKETSAAIPGGEDTVVIDIPKEGDHVFHFRREPGGKGTTRFRFQSEEPAPTAGSKPSASRWTYGGSYLFTIAWDDNVWNWDDRDEGNLDNSRDEGKYNHMKTTDDVIMKDVLDAWLQLGTPARNVRAGFRITDKYYFRNHIKWNDEVEVHFRFHIGPDDSLRIFGVARPDVFVRNLDSVKIPGRDLTKARYSDWGGGLRYGHEWCRYFTTALQYRYDLKDYNSNFNNRDIATHGLEAEVRVIPVDWLTIGLRYQFALGNSRARSGEPDTSNRSNAPEIYVDFHYWRILAGVDYRFEQTNYTTSNSATEDPFHAGRITRKQTLKLMAGFRVVKDADVTLEYTRVKSYSNLPGARTSTFFGNDEEALSYESNTWELGMLVRF